jgi:uncharacterized membrane protein YtjA (UPF0391 family)
MARFTVIFLIVAIVAGFFGFGDIRADVAEISQYVCVIFSVACFISLFAIQVKRQ